MQVGEVASFQNGYAFKSKDFIQDGKYKIIKIKELKDGKVKFFDNSACVDVENKEIIKKYGVKKGDVLFALTGDPVSKNNPLSWVGRVAVYEDNRLALLNQRVCKLIPKKGLNAKYIYYYFRAFNNFYTLASIAKGSASQANISTKDIEVMEINLPSLDIQNKIVSILDSIEEKINNNNLINKNLQEQAKALYRNMFIDNYSSEWSMGTLSDISDITMGQSPSGDTYNEKEIGMVFYQGRTDFGFRFPKRRIFTAAPKRIAQAGDVLISVRAPVGDLNVSNETCCIGRGLGAIHAKDGKNSFVLYTLFTLQAQLNVFNCEGTVFGSINQNDLKSMPTAIPDPKSIELFESIVEPMDSTIRSNYDEICCLQELRDSLLPKLMSGKFDFKDMGL